MKTILSIILLIGVVGVSIIVYSSQDSSTAEVSVLHDITDTLLSQPIAGEITPLFGLGSQKWNGAAFRYATISDVSFTPAQEARIGPANQWLSNEYDRTKEVNRFYSVITELITNSQKESIGKSHSSVYMTIAAELNRLSKSKSTKRILLVYSDLMENDLNFSFYDVKTFNLLSSHPDTIRKRLEMMLPITTLSGIEIHLLYQPPNPQSDIQFKVVSGYYKQLLESKGAIVYISANLQ